MIDQHGLTVLRELAGALKKQAATGGGEYAGPCPFCGGTDRFRVQPNAANGGKWMCRQCHPLWSDTVEFVARRDNATIGEALRSLNLNSNGNGSAPQAGRKRAQMLDVPDAPEDWRLPLLKRGISAATIARYRLESVGDFWRYPTIAADNGTYYRLKNQLDKEAWKAAHGDQPYQKYKWDGQKPKQADVRYYSAGLLRAAVERENGVLWLSSGEPNVWVLHSAFCAEAPANSVNATFWFDGEKSVPQTLAADLKAIGARVVMYAPDCDATGVESAFLVRDLLKGSDLEFKCLQLPGEAGSAYDLNDLWLDCNCDSEALRNALAALPVFEFEAEVKPVLAVGAIDAMADFLISLSPFSVPDGEPLPIPFKSFHRLGGFAKVLMPGKGMGVMAFSGGGKTSFCETWADCWNQMGFDGFLWGAEWTPHEYSVRRANRYTGIPYAVLTDWELWKAEAARGIPEHLRQGRALMQGERQALNDAGYAVMDWPGELVYFPEFRLLSDLLEDMRRVLHIRRKAGRRVGFAIFDYVQIIKMMPGLAPADRYDLALEMIKAWAVENRLVWIVGSQVRKEDSKAAKQNGTALESEAAYFIRDDKFNLFIGLQIETKDDPDSGERHRTGRGFANITKNSPGITDKLTLKTDFSRLRWAEFDFRGAP